MPVSWKRKDIMQPPWGLVATHDYTEFAETGILLQWPAANTPFSKATWKDFAADGLDGRKQAPTPLLAEDGTCGNGKRRTPRRSVREDEMATQTVGSTRACVRLASTLECLGKRSVPSPPTPARARTHCCPALNTWYISGGIWPRWLLAAALRLRQLGVLALPLHQLPVAPPG